ncbi:unnamed protein product [Urochloa humidicola]
MAPLRSRAQRHHPSAPPAPRLLSLTRSCDGGSGTDAIQVKKNEVHRWCICGSLCRSLTSTVQPYQIYQCELNMHLPLKGELLLPGARTMAHSQVLAVSETARRGCCKVCKEPEEEGKKFLVCGHSLCMYKYYHIMCLNPDQIASEKQEDDRWYCPSCLCRGCYCDVDDNEIVMCDRCDEAYHIYCMEPPRTSVPKGDWYCKSCTKARKQERYEEKMMKLDGKRRRVMVKSNKFKGFDLLVACAEKLRREEEAAAEKLRRKEAAAAEKLRRKEAAAAEKLRRKEEEAATTAGEAATAAE